MNKKAAILVTGTLAGAFAFSAGLWSLYPENREVIADLGRSVGLLDRQPPRTTPPTVFIRTGEAPANGYQPAAAAQGCSADGKIMRLIYRMAITEDARREELLDHPRISGNQNKYETLRRDAAISHIQALWQEESANFNAEAGKNIDPAAFQIWLQNAAANLYETEGLKVSFEINSQTGLEIREASATTINACRPAPAPR